MMTPLGLTLPQRTDRPVAIGFRSPFVFSWVQGDTYISVQRTGRSGSRLIGWIPAPQQREWTRLGLMDQIARQWVETQRQRRTAPIRRAS